MTVPPPPSPASPAERRHPGWDAARGVAVLAVWLFHDGWLGCGWIGVPVFFALSGALVDQRLQDDRQPGAAARFARARAARLLPAWLGLLLLLGLQQALGGPSLPWPYLLSGTQNLPFAHQVEGARGPWVAHLWSLAAEIQCYAAWAGLVLVARAGARTAAAVTLVWPLLRWLLWAQTPVEATYDRWDLVYQALPHDAFAWGVLANRYPQAMSRAAPGLLASVLGLGCLAVALDPPTTAWGWTSLGWPFGEGAWWRIGPGLGLLGAAAAGALLRLPRAGVPPILVHLGQRSYALYLLHWPLLAWTGGAAPLDWPWALRLARWITLVGLGLLLAEVSWLGLEEPARRWIRGAKGAPTPAPGLRDPPER